MANLILGKTQVNLMGLRPRDVKIKSPWVCICRAFMIRGESTVPRPTKSRETTQKT